MRSLSLLVGNPRLLDPAGAQVFTAEECDRIIASADAEWTPYRIAADEEGNRDAVVPETRSVVGQPLGGPPDEFPNRQLLEAITAVNAEVFRFDLVGIYPEDGLSILRYEADTNDHYRPHRDYGPGYTTRKLTVIVQLTDGDAYVGGDLYFPDAGTAAPRDRGTMILFPSFLSHTVTPVVRGTRHVIVGWVHGPTFR